jgi:hypothetical protein
MFDYKLPDIFSANEHDKRLMQLLQGAYIGGRYKSDYFVKEWEARKIMEKVKELEGYEL